MMCFWECKICTIKEGYPTRSLERTEVHLYDMRNFWPAVHDVHTENGGYSGQQALR